VTTKVDCTQTTDASQWKRTGEFRLPVRGEWFEDAGGPSYLAIGEYDAMRGRRWILRLVDAEPKYGYWREPSGVRWFKYIGPHPCYELIELRPGDSAAWLHWSNGEVTNEGPHWNEEYIIENPQAFQRINEAEAKELIRQLQPPVSPPDPQAERIKELERELADKKNSLADSQAEVCRLKELLQGLINDVHNVNLDAQQIKV
jgi:hypothetical protein